MVQDTAHLLLQTVEKGIQQSIVVAVTALDEAAVKPLETNQRFHLEEHGYCKG